MRTYKLEIFNGHPIIEENDNIILVDTGAPSTIHRTDELSLNSDNFNVVSSYLGLDVDKISEMLGKEITTLMGADILSQYKILIDYENRIIAFSEKEINFNGEEISLSSFDLYLTLPNVMCG